MKNLQKLTINSVKILKDKDLKNLKGGVFLFQCWAYHTWIPYVDLDYYETETELQAVDLCVDEWIHDGDGGYCTCS